MPSSTSVDISARPSLPPTITSVPAKPNMLASIALRWISSPSSTRARYSAISGAMKLIAIASASGSLVSA